VNGAVISTISKEIVKIMVIVYKQISKLIDQKNIGVLSNETNTRPLVSRL
jgi:hypothetical protein